MSEAYFVVIYTDKIGGFRLFREIIQHFPDQVN